MPHRIDFMTKSVLSIALTHFDPLTPVFAFPPMCWGWNSCSVLHCSITLFFFFLTTLLFSFGNVLMNNLKLFQHFLLFSLTWYKNINDAWKRTWQNYIWDSGKCFWNWLTFFLSKLKKKKKDSPFVYFGKYSFDKVLYNSKINDISRSTLIAITDFHNHLRFLCTVYL